MQTFPNHHKPCQSASQLAAPVVTVVAMVGIHLQTGALSDLPIQFDRLGRQRCVDVIASPVKLPFRFTDLHQWGARSSLSRWVDCPASGQTKIDGRGFACGVVVWWCVVFEACSFPRFLFFFPIALTRRGLGLGWIATPFLPRLESQACAVSQVWTVEPQLEVPG